MSLYRKQSSPAIIILFLIILASACKNSEISSDIITINIDKNENNSPIKYSKLFEDYRIVPLYPSGDSVLGQINDVVNTNNNIIAYDNKAFKGVLIFNKKGNVISGIKYRGRGPGEYSYPIGIDIDTVSRKIYLLDLGKKICIYDFKGRHVKDIKIEDSFSDIALFNSKLYLCNTNISESILMICNLSGKKHSIIEDIPSVNRESAIRIRRPGDFAKTKEKLLLSFPLEETIYSIEDNRLVPYLTIESEEFGKPIELSLQKETSITNFLSTFSKNENLIYFQIFNGKNIHFDNYFHIINESKTIGTHFNDDLSFVSPTFLKLSGDQMITYLRPEYIFRLKEKIAKGNITVLQKIGNALSKINYDNYYPILIIYDLKEKFDF